MTGLRTLSRGASVLEPQVAETGLTGKACGRVDEAVMIGFLSATMPETYGRKTLQRSRGMLFDSTSASVFKLYWLHD